MWSFYSIENTFRLLPAPPSPTTPMLSAPPTPAPLASHTAKRKSRSVIPITIYDHTQQLESCRCWRNSHFIAMKNSNSVHCVLAWFYSAWDIIAWLLKMPIKCRFKFWKFIRFLVTAARAPLSEFRRVDIIPQTTMSNDFFKGRLPWRSK